jgi:N-methylhydantoinase B
MAYAMRDIVGKIEWHPGDMVIVNDPFLGGTHLPDVTLIAPVFNLQQSSLESRLLGFVVNRAHHADIGAESPGSMPLSHRLDEEGLVIPPSFLLRQGKLDEEFLSSITNATRNPREAHGDFAAQVSANRSGIQRLQELIAAFGIEGYKRGLLELNEYAERLARNALSEIPDGEYRFVDVMDDDGQGHEEIPIEACVRVSGHLIEVDFTGTAPQVHGNINCPISVVAAAVYYVFRCLMPDHTPACAGTFRPVSLHVPDSCLLNAKRPAAVAAGNVETSTRVVDVVMGALAQAIPGHIPAASHGSMNNLAMGSAGPEQVWDYYETIGGGMGAGIHTDGLSAVQTHMTNTLNTPVEVLEMRFPLRVNRYQVRSLSY